MKKNRYFNLRATINEIFNRKVLEYHLVEDERRNRRSYYCRDVIYFIGEDSISVYLQSPSHRMIRHVNFHF